MQFSRGPTILSSLVGSRGRLVSRGPTAFYSNESILLQIWYIPIYHQRFYSHCRRMGKKCHLLPGGDFHRRQKGKAW